LNNHTLSLNVDIDNSALFVGGSFITTGGGALNITNPNTGPSASGISAIGQSTVVNVIGNVICGNYGLAPGQGAAVTVNGNVIGGNTGVFANYFDNGVTTVTLNGNVMGGSYGVVIGPAAANATSGANVTVNGTITAPNYIFFGVPPTMGEGRTQAQFVLPTTLTGYRTYTRTSTYGATSTVWVYNPSFDVTVNGGGATVHGSGQYTQGATVTVGVAQLDGHTFNGWTVIPTTVVLADANKMTTTFTMPAAAVTVTAGCTPNPSDNDTTAGTGNQGGGGSSNGGASGENSSSSDGDTYDGVSGHTGNNGTTPIPSPSPNPSPTPQHQPPQSPITFTIIANDGIYGESNELEIPATIITNADTGSVTLKMTIKTINALLSNALTTPVPTITLDLSAPIETENSENIVITSVTLPGKAIQTFANAEAAVKVILPAGIITLTPEALIILAESAEIMGLTADTSITIEAFVVPMNHFSGMQAAQVKSCDTAIGLDVFVGGEKVDIPLAVSIPYTLKPNEKPAAVRAWHMDAHGGLTCMNGTFDPATGMITFAIQHQSYFVVGYDPLLLWLNPFTDIARDAWYYDAVAFANSRGIFTGVGNGVFAPYATMTRAMLITMLYRMEGEPMVSVYYNRKFTDVIPVAWYHDAIQWAAENGLTLGIGGNRFAPYRPITREEAVVLLSRYSNYKGYIMPTYREMAGFIDITKISPWAEEAVRKLYEAGVLRASETDEANGVSSGLRPLEAATRAEVADMLLRFERFVII
jgi:hypothetical protein